MPEDIDDKTGLITNDVAKEIDCHEALKLLRASYHKELVSSVRHLSNSTNEAEETAQDAYLPLLERGGVRTLSHWWFRLKVAARNIARDRRRRRKRWITCDDFPGADELLEPSRSDTPLLEARDTLQRVDEFLEELPDKYRRAMIMRRVHGLPAPLIGQELGISARTVNRYVNQVLAYCLFRLKGSTVREAKERCHI